MRPDLTSPDGGRPPGGRPDRPPGEPDRRTVVKAVVLGAAAAGTAACESQPAYVLIETGSPTPTGGPPSAGSPSPAQAGPTATRNPFAPADPTATGTPGPGSPGPGTPGPGTPGPGPGAGTTAGRGVGRGASRQPAPATTTRRPSASPTASRRPAGAIVRLADVPVGGSVITSGRPAYAVARPSARTVTCHVAVCPHQLCPVQAKGAMLECFCHGSEFDAFTGKVLLGPARTNLTPQPVRIVSGWVVQA